MKKIVIIGAGQLGSRHLQGLAKSGQEISIEVVEPFETSRDTAKQRYEEIEKNPKITDINFYESIDQLSSTLDVVIIATNSDVRSKIVKELLSKKKVNNLILEKVLFQTVDEYSEIKKLLDETLTKCWVNHPRRMFPFYQKLREEIKGCKQINYSVEGGAWGLACNSLHFLDHLSYLSDKSDCVIYNDLLDPKIYETKRANYVEFNGLLTGKFDNHSFSIYSHKDQLPLSMTITTDVLKVHIDEGPGEIKIARKNNDWKWETSKEKIVYYQSELSNILIDEILTTGGCNLPCYDEAMKLHLVFIKSILLHTEKVDGKVHDVCPIT